MSKSKKLGIEYGTMKAFNQLRDFYKDDFPKIEMCQCESGDGHDHHLHIIIKLINYNEDEIKVLVACILSHDKPIHICWSRVIK